MIDDNDNFDEEFNFVNAQMLQNFQLKFNYEASSKIQRDRAELFKQKLIY